MSYYYENNDEINEKIKNKSPPTEKDKESLLNKLNKQLNEEEHLHIFTEYLQTLDKRIYSITANCTLFDINDLPNEVFWKIVLCTHFFIRDHEKQKEIDKANEELSKQSDLFNEKVNNDLILAKDNPINAAPESLDGLSNYEKLRITALSQCNYSTYVKVPVKSEYNLCLPDDKRMEKTIYSDTFRHRWKQNDTKKDDIIETQPQQQQPSSKLIDMSLSGSIDDIDDGEDGEDGDGDGDENMFNDNDDNDNTEEVEKAEIDRLKNQLLKMTKLTLKATPMSYEEDDD